MDELTDAIDKLNTNAQEWVPSSYSEGREKKTKESSWKLGKEFIPSGYEDNAGVSIAQQDNFQQTLLLDNGAISSEPCAEEDVQGEDLLLPWWAHGSSTVPVTMRPNRHSLRSLGGAELLWNYYRNATVDTIREMDPSDPLIKAVPPSFMNAYCLDRNSGHRAGSFGYPSNVFKVVSREDGRVYCLRRFDNTKLSNRILAAITEKWSCISHPGICRLHRCFLGQRAVFFVHDYCAGGVQSINDRFLSTPANNSPLSERLIWSYITQLVSILRHIHSSGLACRSLNPCHVLLVGGGARRLRLSCCGVLDALEFEARKTVQELQQDDLVNLGRLILSLTTGTKITATTNVQTLRSCEAFILQKYSADLHRLVIALLTSGNGTSQQGLSLTIFSVCTMMSNHAWEELEVAHSFSDAYSDELSKCYESTRSLRLLIKLGLINERPEFGMDTQWSETGDRYVLKLFRDYIFHQAREDGSPVLDLGHIITSLNKLDTADPEKIVLVSRDGASLLVVSYADISRCVEEAYEELCNADTTVLESDFGGLDNMSQPPLFASGGSPARSGGGIGDTRSAARFSHHPVAQPQFHRNNHLPSYQPSFSLQQNNMYPQQQQQPW